MPKLSSGASSSTSCPATKKDDNLLFTKQKDEYEISQRKKEFEDIKKQYETLQISKALQQSSQKYLNGNIDTTTSYLSEYGELLDKLKKNIDKLTSEEYSAIFEKLTNMKLEDYRTAKSKSKEIKFEFGNIDERLPVEELKDKTAELPLSEQDILDEANKTVEQKSKALENVKEQYQSTRDEEGIFSDGINALLELDKIPTKMNNLLEKVDTGKFLLMGAISLFKKATGATSRSDVNNAIEKEDKNVHELEELLKEKDIEKFRVKYEEITGTKFKVENLDKIKSAQDKYQILQCKCMLKKLHDDLKNNRYSSCRLDSYEDQIYDPKKHHIEPSQLEKSLLELFQGNKKNVVNWIKTATRNHHLEKLPENQRYEYLKNLLLNYTNILDKNVIEKCSDAEEEYMQTIKNAFGENIPENVLKNYVTTQEVGHAVAKTAITIAICAATDGLGILPQAAANGVGVGIYDGIETGTDKDGFTKEDMQDAIKSGASFALCNASCDIAAKYTIPAKFMIAHFLKAKGIHPTNAIKIAKYLNIPIQTAAMVSMDTTIAAMFNEDLDMYSELLVAGGYSGISSHVLKDGIYPGLEFVGNHETLSLLKTHKGRIIGAVKNGTMKTVRNALAENCEKDKDDMQQKLENILERISSKKNSFD